MQKRLESVNGVGEVLLFGARRREIQVKIDPDRLNAYALSTTDVAAALRAQNLELPGGRLEQGTRELSVRTVGRLRTPEDFNDLVVATRGNIPIRIRDIGTRRRHRRRSQLGVDAQRQAGDHGRHPQAERRQHRRAGRRHQARGWRRSRRRCRRTSRSGWSATTPSSSAPRSHAIEEHLILGGILAAVIVLIFLRNFRSTLIAAVAIPTSIIGAFAVMPALDFTLNQMTMLALTLMVGIVIDDAIVVLENIYRFVEEKGHDAVPGGDRGHARRSAWRSWRRRWRCSRSSCRSASSAASSAASCRRSG